MEIFLIVILILLIGGCGWCGLKCGWLPVSPVGLAILLIILKLLGVLH